MDIKRLQMSVSAGKALGCELGRGEGKRGGGCGCKMFVSFGISLGKQMGEAISKEELTV